MKLLKALSVEREKTFAVQLAAELMKNLPPKQIEERKKNLSVNKITKQLEHTYQLASLYRDEHKTGVVKRAIIANAFKWALKEGGYPEDFIGVATEGLIVSLTKKTEKTT